MKPVELQICSLCQKVIERNEGRVHFLKKTYHGPCFVNHCKKNHTKFRYDHETPCSECGHLTREHDAGHCYHPGCQCPKNGKGHEPKGDK